jgi:hypothetical protein
MCGFHFRLSASGQVPAGQLRCRSCGFLSFGLNCFDPSHKAAMLTQFARRVQAIGLRLDVKAKQVFLRFSKRQAELLVAHVA